MKLSVPRWRCASITAALLSLLAVGACTTNPSPHAPGQGGWITAWMSAPSLKPKTLRDREMAAYSDQSVRQDVRVGFAADRLRLRLSNELGEESITVGRVDIARIGPDGKPGSPVRVSFAGKEDFTLQPHQSLTSDTVALSLPALTDVAINVYYPEAVQPVAHRLMVRVTSGRQMPDSGLPPVRGPAIVSSVEVAADSMAVAKPTVIVAFGDSITEGSGSHVPHGDWPSRLGQQLEQTCPGGFVVLNAGISGNQLLVDGGSPSGESRLDRDVLSVEGVSHVILLEGINDIRHQDDTQNKGTTDDLAAGYRRLVERLHARNIKVIGATLTPYKGTARQSAMGLDSVARLNELIRNGGLFDGVIDFYAALEDPANPGQMRPEMSSGDWLHPGDAGYAAMAAAISPALFGPCRTRLH
jgi:lysophospholipase L1-like esterase